MIKDYSDATVMIYDNGLFVELAVKLAKSFKEVRYHTPWENAFPKSNQRLAGVGLEKVVRVNDFWGNLDGVDLFVFPDVYAGSIQLTLEKMGKKVWGSRKGDELELYRRESKEYLRQLGCKIGNYTVVDGMEALRKHLKSHPKQYVKISLTRGDMESFYSESYDLIEPKLDEVEYNLGKKKKVMQFICEDAIEDAVELAYDGYTVDGKYPQQTMFGVEIKDKGYIGLVKNYSELPRQVRELNAQLSRTFQTYRYRNFFSGEMRVTKDGTAWVIDPCCRFGSPPSEVMLELYDNLPDILWFGAGGQMVEPVMRGKFGVELLIQSTWADKNWQAISFPPEIRDNVKLRNLCCIDKEFCVVPQAVGLPEIGAVVAVGETLEATIMEVKRLSKMVKGYYIEIFDDTLEEAVEELRKLEQMGMGGS